MRTVYAVWPPAAAALRPLMHALSHSLHVLLPLSLFAGALSYHVLSMMAPRYVAEAKFSVWPKGQGQPAGEIAHPATRPGLPAAAPADPYVPRGVIAEHVAALASPELALAIAQEFNLANRAEFNSARGDYDAWTRLARRWGMRGPGTGATDQQRFLSAFAAKLQVYSPPQGQAIHIRFTSISAELAASVANRLGAAYRSKLASEPNADGGPPPIDLEVIRRAQPSYVQVFPNTRPVSLAAAFLTFLLGCAAIVARERATTGAPERDPRADAAAIARIRQRLYNMRHAVTHTRRRVRMAARRLARALRTRARLAQARVRQHIPTLKLEVSRQRAHFLSLAARGRAAMGTRLGVTPAANGPAPIPANPSEAAVGFRLEVWSPRRTRRLLALIRLLRRALTRQRAAAMLRLAATKPASHRARQVVVDFASSRIKSLAHGKLALPAWVKVAAKLPSLGKLQIPAWPKVPVRLRLPLSFKSPVGAESHGAKQAKSWRRIWPSSAAKLKLSLGAAKAWGASLRGRLTLKAAPTLLPATSEAPDPPIEAFFAAAGVREINARPRPRKPARSDLRSILTLATRLDQRRGAVGLRVVIAGANANVRAAQEALALTHALADRAASTILVDVTASANGVANAANLPAAPGLSDVLSGKLDIAAAVRTLPGRRAHVLTAGASTKRLSGETVDSLLQTLSATYDVIVVTGAHAEASRLFRTSATRFDAVVTAGGEDKDTFLGHPAGDVDVFNLEVQPNSAVAPDRMRRALDARRSV